MTGTFKRASVLILLTAGCQALAQQPTTDFMAELEFGAVVTSGNSEAETLTYGITLDWLRGDWEYQFATDGIRQSKEDELTAQRLLHVGSAQLNFSDSFYWLTRASYEDDRFSGYDYQANITTGLGRMLLQDRENMTLDVDASIGYRQSESETEDFGEGIIRLSGEYEWNLSETATFFQDLSAELGEESNIYRSETGVESEIMESVSLRFAYAVKHQSEVPPEREKTDTTMVVTLVWNF